jgi:hypothetical protein
MFHIQLYVYAQHGLGAEHAAKQLARIAAWYGFEGWLVNIESKVPQGVLFLDLFLRVLTAEMHRLLDKQALVMWCALQPLLGFCADGLLQESLLVAVQGGGC